MVERRELVELAAGEQPEVEQGRRKRWVCEARGQLDERRQGQGHLLDLALQLLVALGPSGAKARGGVRGEVFGVAVAAPGGAWGRWWLAVVAA